MFFYSYNSSGSQLIPLDVDVGIKRVLLTGSTDESGLTLRLADGSDVFTGYGAKPVEFTFLESPYGYPSSSCFLVEKKGDGVGRIFIDTSPFSNQNYFETEEGTL
jgi:hypothetical protein